ncbi:MAG: biopolymer transporter ExbD [Pseudomonadales bacterium]|nr:biopolymer transporter ExbD [Pseudomonadales bacterium]
MKQSLRARRMAKQHKRAKNKADGLNLTSLMDIFTILVFFLMANSGEAQLLKDTETIEMPKSSADKAPRETLVLQVDATTIVIQGKKIALVADVRKLEDDIIPALQKELVYQAARKPMTEEEKEVGRAITIQGDKGVPFIILRKLMATSAGSEYRDISLAVSKSAKKSSAGGD